MAKTKKKILVVDDEYDFSNMVRMRLEASNFEVVLANNGKEALDRVKSNKPDAVLLDIMMPEIDGLDVLKKIRETDKILPVFLITAFSNEEKVRTASKFNASGYILKSHGNLAEEIKNIESAIEIAEKFRAQKKSP